VIVDSSVARRGGGGEGALFAIKKHLSERDAALDSIKIFQDAIPCNRMHANKQYIA
jgi:hypothetical protein